MCTSGVFWGGAGGASGFRVVVMIVGVGFDVDVGVGVGVGVEDVLFEVLVTIILLVLTAFEV